MYKKCQVWRALLGLLRMLETAELPTTEMVAFHHPVIQKHFHDPFSDLQCWTDTVVCLKANACLDVKPITVLHRSIKEGVQVLKPDKTKLESYATYQLSGFMLGNLLNFSKLHFLICKMLILSFHGIRRESNKLMYFKNLVCQV